MRSPVRSQLGYASNDLLVGAPYKDEVGLPEQQNISCVADGGHFTLSLRGFTSAPIAWNATVAQLRAALTGEWGSLEVRRAILPSISNG